MRTPFSIVLLLLLCGCALDRAKAGLDARLDAFERELLDVQDTRADPSEAAAVGDGAALDRVRDLRDEVATASSVAAVRKVGHQLERSRANKRELDRLLDDHRDFLAELRKLESRYADAAAGTPAAEFRAKLQEAQRGTLTLVPSESLEKQVRRTREALAGLKARIADASPPSLPHLGERSAALEERIDILLPLAKQRRDDAEIGTERRRKLEDATTLLEDASRRLTGATGSAGVDPRSLLEATTQVDDAAEKLDDAAAAVTVRPNPWFRTHAGFATLSPYTVRRATPEEQQAGANALGTPTFTLVEGDSSPAFYVEADFLHRWAWLLEKDRTEPAPSSVLGGMPWLAPSDWEIRTRFTNTDDIDGASSAAAGDWAAEASLGWPIYEYANADGTGTPQDDEPHGTFNLELNGGITTDRGDIDVRGYVQLGFGSVWSFPVELAPQVVAPATVFGGLYYGIHEFPRVNEDNFIRTDAARPYYNELGALGVKVDVVYPLSESVEFVVGGRLAGVIGKNDIPEDWSLFVGVSLPLGRLFGNGEK